MENVWEISTDKLIEELAMLEELENELQKRLCFGVDYREKYEALGYAEVVTGDYYDDTLEAIAEEVHEVYMGYVEYEDLEDLEDLYSYSDTITDGKRVAFLEFY